MPKGRTRGWRKGKGKQRIPSKPRVSRTKIDTDELKKLATESTESEEDKFNNNEIPEGFVPVGPPFPKQKIPILDFIKTILTITGGVLATLGIIWGIFNYFSKLNSQVVSNTENIKELKPIVQKYTVILVGQEEKNKHYDRNIETIEKLNDSVKTHLLEHRFKDDISNNLDKHNSD